MAKKQARIVVIGGGFGGLFTALELADEGEVTLVSAEDHFTFRPMLYEYLSGEVEAWHIAPHYRELLDDKVRFIHGAARDVDFAARTVAVEGWAEPLAYDALVLAGGGASGCELSTKMGDLLRDAFQRRGLSGEPRVVVVEMAEHVVPGMGDELREYVEEALREAGVEVHTRTRVRRATPEGMRFEQAGAETELEAAAGVLGGGGG